MKRRVLVIEDDVPLRFLLERMLRAHYAVKITDNGLEACSWLSDGESFDLIISDVHMAAVNGIELLEYLRENILFSHIPVIIISSISDYRQQCMELGACAYLEKPFEPERLFEHIQEALESKTLQLPSEKTI